MISIAELREILAEEVEGATDEELEPIRGLLYLVAELAVESVERDQQETAA